MASHPGIVIRLLTWNLRHGRDDPPEELRSTLRSRLSRRTIEGEAYADVNRSLRSEFLSTLAGWRWDLALLQEVPPSWLGDIERVTGARGRRVLTSRNWLAPARRKLAGCNPDLIASNEGGSNVLLARPPLRISAALRRRLAVWPERRLALIATIDLPEGRRLVVANVHLSVPATGRGPSEVLRAAGLVADRAAGGPMVLGGDLNLRPADARGTFELLEREFGLAGATAPRSIDHLLAAGLEPVEAPAPMSAAARELPGPDGLTIRLSDHPPVTAAFRLR